MPTREADERPGVTWRAIEAIPVFLLATTATVGVVFVLSRLISSCRAQFVLDTLVGELAFGLSVFLWVRYVNRAPLSALGAPRAPWRDLVVGVLVGAALIVVGGLALSLAREAASLIVGHKPPPPQQVVPCVTGWALGALAPVVILAAPLGEETFFRDFLYQGLRRRFGLPVAAVVSSILFGAVHVSPLLIPALFVVGLGLAWVYERRQSLVASVAAHATFNLIGFVFIALGRG